MPRTIRNEPNWENLFAAAIRISETNIDKNEGQQLVVEMLEYGQRLYLERKKMTEHSDEHARRKTQDRDSVKKIFSKMQEPGFS